MRARFSLGIGHFLTTVWCQSAETTLEDRFLAPEASENRVTANSDGFSPFEFVRPDMDLTWFHFPQRLTLSAQCVRRTHILGYTRAPTNLSDCGLCTLHTVHTYYTHILTHVTILIVVCVHYIMYTYYIHPPTHLTK